MQLGFEKKMDSFTRALATLKEIAEEPYSPIVRDASIQRFEYTFEAMWKMLQKYLKEREGVIAQSPKSVIRELLALNLVSPEETELLLDMADKRNLSSHTYLEEIAELIYSHLKQYRDIMAKVKTVIQQRSA
jgi:nucleotidyltransferase substrate binding protein (TIGR01987 family)